MDSVRFGRALGFGARSAARALAGAVDAATAPNPGRQEQPAGTTASQPRATAAGPIVSAAQSAGKTAARATIRTQVRVHETRKGVARGSKRFGEAVWGPFVKLSGVLWLEVTGSFFGIFALFAGNAAWNHRAEFRPDVRSTPISHDARLHAFVFLAMTLVFGYFCISSFVRAYRR